MKKFALCVAVLSVLAINGLASAEVGVKLEDDNMFYVTGSGESIVALNLLSKGGYLVPGALATPFTVQIPAPNQIAFANFGSMITVNGSVKTSAGYNPDKKPEFFSDVTADFGDASGTHAIAASAITCPTCVPEPTSALLAGMGSLALMAFRRRR